MASPETTTNAIIIAPAAANAVSITPSGTNFANSAYTELIAANAESSAIVILGVVVDNANVAVEDEVDIATGSAGSEVVIGTLRLNHESASCHVNIAWFPIPIDNAAANVRIAVRMRKSGTSTLAWTFALMYYRKPVGGTVTATASASLSAPSAASGVSITPSGTAWANSAYGEVITSTSTAIVLGAVIFNSPVNAVQFEIDIATGAAASEVVVSTVRGFPFSVAGGPCILYLRTPLDNIPTSTRVAVRMRKEGINTVAWTFAILYYAKPI